MHRYTDTCIHACVHGYIHMYTYTSTCLYISKATSKINVLNTCVLNTYSVLVKVHDLSNLSCTLAMKSLNDWQLPYVRYLVSLSLNFFIVKEK